MHGPLRGRSVDTHARTSTDRLVSSSLLGWRSLGSSRPSRGVLKARGRVGVGSTPFLQLFDELGTYTCCDEQGCGLPDLAAGNASVRRRRWIAALRQADSEVSADAILQGLVQRRPTQ